MDDEAAEIELLEQNLHKTRQISQRMVSILSSFDTRLGKLEKSIHPLYASTQLLTRRGNNIEAALIKIDEVASSQEGVAAEEQLILRGPQPNQLPVYKEALDRLNASIAFNTGERDARETARLVESGSKKATQFYTQLVNFVTQLSTLNSPLPLDTAEFATLRPLVAMLRTFPVPATHPTHPAAQSILSALKDVQRAYAETRGAWASKVLDGGAKRVIERADIDDGLVVGRLLGDWINTLLGLVETEYGNLSDLAPLTGQAQISQSFTQLLTPVLALFSSTLSSLTALIKRSLHTHAFLALSTLNVLSSATGRWDAAIGLSQIGSNGKKDELRDASTAIRALCLRSFPEFLADVKTAALPRGEVGTGLAEITQQVVTYLEKLPSVKDAAGIALLALGDGNWRMGEGAAVRAGPKLGEGDEAVILEHFVHDTITTTLATLSALGQVSRRPALGAVFQLNNVAYLQSAVLHPMKDIRGMMGKPTRDALASGFRMAKATYFDANYSPLIGALADDGSKKSALKDKFTRFYDLLDEVVERHRFARVLEEDEEAREQMCEEVVKLVIPTLQRFTQKGKEKEFSKNPQKYIKLTPEEVEKQIRGFYV